MTSALALANSFSLAVASELPTVPGLLTRAWFGAGPGNDGISSNRVAGGPPITNFGNPILSSNYATVGNLGGSFTALETGNTRSSGMLASGWTWIACARGSGSNTGYFFGDGETGGSGATPQFGFSASAIIMLMGGTKITLTPITPVTGWHFVAVTYAGGTQGLFTLGEYTDNLTPGTYQGSPVLAAGTDSFHFGLTGLGGESTFGTGPTDICFGQVSSGVMSQGAIQALVAAVRPTLAKRGITA